MVIGPRLKVSILPYISVPNNNIQIPQQDLSLFDKISYIFIEIIKLIFSICFLIGGLVSIGIPLVLAIIIVFSWWAFIWTHT